jgi:hypothetical protein
MIKYGTKPVQVLDSAIKFLALNIGREFENAARIYLAVQTTILEHAWQTRRNRGAK